MTKITIDLNYFKDISSETALVGFDYGRSFAEMIKFNSKKSYFILIPENVIAVNNSFIKGLLYEFRFMDEKQFMEKFTSNHSFFQKNIDYAYRSFNRSNQVPENLSWGDQIEFLEEKLDSLGYFTKKDLFNLKLPYLIKVILFINYYLDWHLDVSYVHNQMEFSEKSLVPKESLDQAEVRFKYSEDCLDRK